VAAPTPTDATLPTIRTPQLAQPKLPFHHTHIKVYRDHDASASSHGPPDTPPRDFGRAVTYPDVITLASHTKKGNPHSYPATTSSPSMTPKSHLVLNQRGG